MISTLKYIIIRTWLSNAKFECIASMLYDIYVFFNNKVYL